MADLPETIFGHIPSGSEYNPPIPQTDVSYLEADLSIRPVKDDDNPSDTTTFSSNKIITYLSTKLDDGLTGDVDKYLKWTATGQEWADVSSLTVNSADSEVATIDPSTSVLSFPTIKIQSVNTILGSNAASYSSIGRTTLLGRDAGYNSGNLSDFVGVGWQCGYMASNSMWSTHLGTQSGKYRRQTHTTCVGRFAGGLANVGQGAGSAGYTHNTYLGSSSGAGHLTGSNCLYLGAGVNEANGDSRLLIGSGADHLIKGTFGTTANADIELNADNIKVPSTLKTQADLANLSVGQVYVDTSAGNTLKVKL